MMVDPVMGTPRARRVARKARAGSMAFLPARGSEPHEEVEGIPLGAVSSPLEASLPLGVSDIAAWGVIVWVFPLL